MTKNILVTGGAGFIGSHLCEVLFAEGNCVYSLDNYFTGSVNNHVPGVNYIRGDTQEIDSLITDKIEVVYHLGEYARVEQSFSDAQLVWRFNKSGTFAVINFCLRTGAKLVYAGSSTKFCDGDLGRKQSPYAWSKASNIDLIVNYGQWFGLRYAIAYFYNVYGGREVGEGKYATVIALYKEKRRVDEPLPIVSPGTQQRNFTHVDDIVRGLILVGNHGVGDDYGIGHSATYTISQIAGLFGGEVEVLPERAGNRQLSFINTKKIEQLGWKATYCVRIEIEKFIKSLVDAG